MSENRKIRENVVHGGSVPIEDQMDDLLMGDAITSSASLKSDQTVGSSRPPTMAVNSSCEYKSSAERHKLMLDIENITSKHDKPDNVARASMRSSNLSISINKALPTRIEEFKAWRNQIKVEEERPRYYEFTSGETGNKFRICIATVDRLINNGEQCLKEVDLSAKQTASPNANRNDDQLVKALNHNQIEHIVSAYTKNIYVRNCEWSTVYKISNLVAELNCDLTVSGGGHGEYMMEELGTVEWERQRQKITIDYHQNIISSCPDRDPERSVKVGIIDSGCSLSLYNQIVSDGKVVMHHGMIDATRPNVREVPYDDCEDEGHGTVVVEIVAKCAVAKTEIYVANLGKPFYASNLEAALNDLRRNRNCKVFNLSLTIYFDSDHIRGVIKEMKSEGVIFVAATGNTYSDFITSDLNDNKTIMVGSHNNDDSISQFSDGKCMTNVVSLGENIYADSVFNHIRSGTSFAAPHVTTVVSNIVSYCRREVDEDDVWKFLGESCSDVTCVCNRHRGNKTNLKLNPDAIMQLATL